MRTLLLFIGFSWAIASKEEPQPSLSVINPHFNLPEGWTQLSSDYVRSKRGDTLRITRYVYHGYNFQILSKNERNRAFKQGNH